MTTDSQKFANAGASPDESAQRFSGEILGRMETLTLALGAVGTAWAAWRWGWRGGAGLALGALLSWVNFRWLKGSVQSFGQAAAAAGAAGRAAAGAPPAEAGGADPGAANAAAAADRPRAPVKKTAYFQFLGRYALLLGGVYVILTRTSLPAAAVFLGLFAAAASVVVGLLNQLLSLGVRQSIRAR